MGKHISFLHLSSIPCRLKRNALPSIFPPHEFEEPSVALQSRLEFLRKRPLSSVDIPVSPPVKAAKTTLNDHELEQKIRNKVKSLQQQLRRSEQKA